MSKRLQSRIIKIMVGYSYINIEATIKDALLMLNNAGFKLRETVNVYHLGIMKLLLMAPAYILIAEESIKALDSSIALILQSIADYVEVYPMVISEALTREKPVIASKVGGVPYRVKQNVNGVLVDLLDPKMLAEAMLKIAHDEEDRLYTADNVYTRF